MNAIVIKEHSVASVHYRGTLTNTGDEFDNSAGREPLEFIVGFQQLVPGFEAALMGRGAGEKLTFNLTPDQAYGERNPQAVQVIPLDEIPYEVEVGQRLTLQGPGGQVIALRVSEKSEDSVTLDMNHELAGEHLTFEVEVIEVRDASAEEIAHGMTANQILMAKSAESDCCRSGTCQG